MTPIKVNGKIGDCQRPLRAQTASGETAARAASPLTSSTEQRHCMDRI